LQIPFAIWCDQTKAIAEKHFRKNTVGPNEFTDFENFDFEHTPQPKRFFMLIYPKHPGTGTSLTANRSTIM